MDFAKMLQSKLEQAIANGNKKVDITVGDEVIGYVDLSIYYMLMEAIQIGVKKERNNLNETELTKLVGNFTAKYSDQLFHFELFDESE